MAVYGCEPGHLSLMAEVVVNVASRWSWGPKTRRREVIRLVVYRTDDGPFTAVTVGVVDGQVHEHSRDEVADGGVMKRGRDARVTLTDGRVLAPGGVGCGCNVPKLLVNFSPQLVGA